ncbi:MAG: DUF4835 family protein [Flavobacteriales bacterium]|jgi:hypothetical protein
MNRLILLLLFSWGSIALAQELNCKVSIIKEASLEVNSTELEIFKELELVLTELMNNTQWTKDQFKTEERINCNIQLQINKIPTAGTYSGALQVQATRPVFNSNYNTLLFNYRDEDLIFAYSRNTLVTYTPNQFRDNLSSIMAYYAYFILGMDYDSFSKKGGSKYFNECQQIVSNAQSSGAPGWKSSEQGKRNRFWLVDNVLQAAFEPLRDCNFGYHRQGLDVMYDDKVKGKKALYEALNKLTPVVQIRPNSPNVVNYLLCKRDELKKILSDSEAKEKTDFVTLLKRLDPSNSSKYQEILE